MSIREQTLIFIAWILIPVSFEIGRNITVIFTLFKKSIQTRRSVAEITKMEYFPDVSIIIPVYNSSATLETCLYSISKQTYPKDRLEVFLLDNGSKDDSFDIFDKFHREHPDMKMWYLYTDGGKAKALNRGIYASRGEYVINIDSDGWLDKNAVYNIASRFSSNPDIDAMTGTVLIDPDLISKTTKIAKKALQKSEFIEYTEAFLIGRNYASDLDTLYTMAGAFSAFRRTALMKTQMYNSETLGEDTHMTIQVREFCDGRIVLAEDAFIYVDPVESFDKLYTQRQRWQRSEMEMARLFPAQHKGNILDIISNPMFRVLLIDHTFGFVKYMWMFLMVYLYVLSYPAEYIIAGNLIIYFTYVINSLLGTFISVRFLVNQPSATKFIKKNRHYSLLMPFYRLLTFYVRVTGILNSLSTKSEWKTTSFSDEVKQIFGIAKR